MLLGEIHLLYESDIASKSSIALDLRSDGSSKTLLPRTVC